MSLTNKGVALGLKAPDFELESLTGQKHRLSSYRGKPTLLFFARDTRYPESARQMEQLHRLYGTINRIAEVVAVLEPDVRRVSARQIRNYLEVNEVPFPVLDDRENRILHRYNVYKNVGLAGYQMSHSSVFLMNHRQEVIYDYVGENPFDYPNLEILMAELHRSFTSNTTTTFSASFAFLPQV